LLSPLFIQIVLNGFCIFIDALKIRGNSYRTKLEGAGRLRITILTGRTIDQGCGKEIGKASEEYVESVAICEMNEKDMKSLGIRDGDRVRITTKFGSVVLTAKKSRRIKSPGTVFVPYGPWANCIMGSDTDGTGMPLLKGVPAHVEPTAEEVLTIRDLINSMMF